MKHAKGAKGAKDLELQFTCIPTLLTPLLPLNLPATISWPSAPLPLLSDCCWPLPIGWVQHREGGDQTCTFCTTLSEGRPLGTCEGLHLRHNFPHAWTNVIPIANNISLTVERERDHWRRRTFFQLFEQGSAFLFCTGLHQLYSQPQCIIGGEQDFEKLCL